MVNKKKLRGDAYMLFCLKYIFEKIYFSIYEILHLTLYDSEKQKG